MTQPKEWKIRALTDIWTGDTRGKPDRLIPTGIMGSLRWWFEVLVRGLGGEACDPTAKDVRCPQASENAESGPRCVVCELFGCTGWARKFRLMILDEQGEVIRNQIKAGQTFTLRFIPLRHVSDEEWCLLDATLRLIADYGAIGGKTVFKPSEEWGIADLGADDLEERNGQVVVHRSRRNLPLQNGDVILQVEGSSISTIKDLKNAVEGKQHGDPIKVQIRRNGQEEFIETWAGKRHHQDFGLVKLLKHPDNLPTCTRKQVEHYVQQGNWRKGIPLKHKDDGKQYDYSWASLQNFWCVKGRYLARQGVQKSTFNAVIGRKQDKSVKEKKGKRVIRWSDLLANEKDSTSRWLAGRQQESKKVFSFKEPARTFGFVKPDLVDFEKMKERLKGVWQGFDPDQGFLTGEQILDKLFQQEETA